MLFVELIPIKHKSELADTTYKEQWCTVPGNEVHK